jgi:hypothetical protein
MANIQATPTFRRDPESAATYHQISKEKVACSVPLSDLVNADYDTSGAVRGIEFVGKQSGSLETFLDRASKASRGPMRKTRGPISGAARGA